MRLRAKAERAVADGSLRRRQELASDNVKLAYYLAHRYKGLIAEDEAISVALEALWVAALHYDPDRKTPFSTYAGIIIANALRTAIRKTRHAELLCLNETLDPDDPGSSDERLSFIQDPASDDWETKLAMRIDCAQMMKESSPKGGAVVFLKDVCGFTVEQASRIVGLKPHIGSVMRRETLSTLKRQLA